MKFNNIAVTEDISILDPLSLEFPLSPDFGELKLPGEILVKSERRFLDRPADL